MDKNEAEKIGIYQYDSSDYSFKIRKLPKVGFM